MIVNDGRGLWTSYELIRISFRDAIFLSDNELVVCGRETKTQQERMQSPLPAVGIILYSLDRGKSWAPIYRSKENETFISLTRVKGNSFYALSDTGTFLRLTLGNE
jgi:hypothetical protein